MNANVLQDNIIFFSYRISCSSKCQCVGCKNGKPGIIFEVEDSSENDSSSNESEISNYSLTDFLLSDENGIVDLFDNCSESEWNIIYTHKISTSACYIYIFVSIKAIILLIEGSHYIRNNTKLK